MPTLPESWSWRAASSSWPCTTHEASAAADAGDWEQAVAEYTMVADADPGYRDTNARLANARHQHQLASLHAEARRLHRAGQWAAVIKVGEQLQAIDPAAADPDGLIDICAR